jgi:hypothetical protein
MPHYRTVGDVALSFGLPSWKLSRLAAKRPLPGQAKAGRVVVFDVTKLDDLRAELVRLGVLVRPTAEAAASV